MLEDLIKQSMRVVTSADAAYRLLRQQGYEFTRSIVRQTWKEVGQKEMWVTVINTWGPERRIPSAWITDLGVGMKHPVHQLLKYQYRDLDGVERVSYVTYTTNKVEPFINFLEKMSQVVEQYVTDQQGTLIEISLGPVFRRG